MYHWHPQEKWAPGRGRNRPVRLYDGGHWDRAPPTAHGLPRLVVAATGVLLALLATAMMINGSATNLPAEALAVMEWMV